MDREKAMMVMEELKRVSFKELEDRLGVRASVGAGTVGATYLTVRVEFGDRAGDGAVAGGRDAEAFKALAHIHGLREGDLGRTFSCRGKSFRVVGLLPRARKHPILAEDAGGRQYKFKASVVAGALRAGERPGDQTRPSIGGS